MTSFAVNFGFLALFVPFLPLFAWGIYEKLTRSRRQAQQQPLRTESPAKPLEPWQGDERYF